MAEPTLNTRNVQWDLTDTTGYTFSNTEFEDDTVEGGILSSNSLGTNGTQDELEDGDYSNWQLSSSLSLESTIVRYGVGSAKVSRTTANQSRILLSSGIHSSSSFHVWFYDSDGTFTGDNFVFWASNSTGVPALITGFGVRASVSTTRYSYFDLSTGTWVDTGIVRSTGWKKISFFESIIGGEPDVILTLKLYVENTLIYQDDNAAVPLRFGTNQTVNGEVFYIDRIWFKRNAGIYNNSGTITFPTAQPTKVKKWLTLIEDKTDGNSGFEGPLTYEAQYSTDGGTNYGTNYPNYDNALYETANPHNLGAVICDADGNDVIRIRSTFESQNNGMFSARLNQLNLTYLDQGLVVVNCNIKNAVLK